MATTLNLILNSKNIAVMKKLMKSLMLFAAAAMALTSCDNEGMNEGIESNDTYTMTFTAGAPESRTSVAIEGDKANFSWCDDDVVGFVQSAVEVEKINKTNSNSIALESGVATFTTNFDAVDGASTYNYGAFYPGNNWKSNASFAEVKVELPAIQTLTDDSFDHEADLLMSEPIWGVANDGHGGLLKFARLAAIGKMTLKNITPGETIESVKLTFADHVLAGDVTLNFDEVTATYATEGSNSIEVKNGSLVAKAENEIFFTCFPGEYTGAYTIEVTTTESIYIKEGNLSGKLAFTAGDVTGFGATVEFVESRTSKTFTKVTKTNLADYSGTYLLVYEEGNVAFDGSLTDLDETNNTQAVTIENDAITASVDIAFTIAKVEGGYSIQSASGKFIGRSATSNGLDTADEYNANYLNTIVDLVIKGKGGKELRYNAANDQKRFRYLGDTMKPVALYRMEGTGSDEELVKALESIEVSGAKTAFTVGDEWAFGGTVTAKYNDGTTEDVTATATVDHSEVNLNIADEYTVTVTYEDKTFEYTVTVSEASAEQTYTVSSFLTELKFSGTTTLTQGTEYSIGDDIIMTIAKGEASNVPAVNQDGTLRLYHKAGADGGSMTLTSEKTITKVVFTFASGYEQISKASVGNYDTDTYTWTGSANSVTFTNGGGTKQARIKTMTITYLGAGGGDTPVVETLATPTNVEAIAVGKEVTIAWDEVANATSYYVTCGTQNATVTATEADFTMDEYDITYEISVVAKADGYNDSVAATTTVTTEADPNAGGGEGGETTKYYVKVTEAPADWSGKYLIVWDTGAHATVSGSDLKKTADVTISNNQIASSATVDAAAVTVAATATNYYSVMLPNGKYLSLSANSNKVAEAASAFNIYFNYTTNGVQILGKDTASNERVVTKNASYYRAYKTSSSSTSGYTLPTLYKLAD